MPELPEVEIVRRTLEPHLLGRRIVRLEILWPKSLVVSELAWAAFNAMSPRIITALKRRGKLLLIELSQKKEDAPKLLLAFHLKMTGQVLIKPPLTSPGKHTRVILDLIDDNGAKSNLFFDDMRKFGFCRIMLPQELELWSFWQNLGPEPLEISSEAFLNCFYKPASKNCQTQKNELMTGKIKNLLMAQHIVAGVGNIYADESLFRAGVRPDTPTYKLTPARLKKLCSTVQEVLKLGIAAGGSSIRDYLDADGKAGAFQEEFLVYGKKGKPCPKCNKPLEHMKLAGRSTVFCSACQK